MGNSELLAPPMIVGVLAAGVSLDFTGGIGLRHLPAARRAGFEDARLGGALVRRGAERGVLQGGELGVPEQQPPAIELQRRQGGGAGWRLVGRRQRQIGRAMSRAAHASGQRRQRQKA